MLCSFVSRENEGRLDKNEKTAIFLTEGRTLSSPIRQAQGGEPVEPRGACDAAIHQSLSPYDNHTTNARLEKRWIATSVVPPSSQ